jgi:shikimate kinase
MPVFLIGLPGAGKSTIGQAVATKLRLPFVDLDREIERNAGKSIVRIFAEAGEPAFRALESEATERLARTPAIVAPGAGWISNEAVRVLVPRAGPTIYLRVEPRTAALRLGAAAEDRPLLAGEPLRELERLLAARRGLYESADAVVDTEQYPFDQVVQRTAELASAFLQHRRE